jgi:hypothetical protein
MGLQHQLHKGLRSVLKYTVNPLTRRLARSSFGPFSIIRHVGRRSGKRYETPIIVAPLGGDFVIELTYGLNVDWRKNVMAGGGVLLRHRKEYVISGIEPVDSATGLVAFPRLQQFILRLLRRKHFEIMKVQQEKLLR